MHAVADATCLACGCLCDDVTATIDTVDNRIVEAHSACPIGRAWFLADRSARDRPIAAIDGEPAGLETAVATAAEILGSARFPIILGLSGTTIEAQAEAVGLADRLGAAVGLAHEGEAAHRIAAVQRVGSVSATLGEVKNRGDLVVFWGVDPLVTHPRHWERYSVEPIGRFVPQGRAGRTVVVVDAERTVTAERADHFLAIPRDRQFASLTALRSLVLGGAAAPEFPGLEDLASRMRQARYGAFFFGPGLSAPPGGRACVEAALLLVRDLNDVTRFVALPLGGPGNPAGAEAVLAWQSGYPLGVDFSHGFPRFRPGGSTDDLFGRGEPDAALVVGDGLTPARWAQLDHIPTIVIAPEATAPGRVSRVALACDTPGIHTGGTVMRSDGLTLPLRPLLRSAWPTDREWLGAIAAGLVERS